MEVSWVQGLFVWNRSDLDIRWEFSVRASGSDLILIWILEQVLLAFHSYRAVLDMDIGASLVLRCVSSSCSMQGGPTVLQV